MIDTDDQKKIITEQVAAQIKEFRLMRSLSQEELALRANLNPAYFGQVERGLKCPTIDTLYKIAKALDVSLSELVCVDRPTDYSKDYSQRINHLFFEIPEEKHNQIFKLLEDIAALY